MVLFFNIFFINYFIKADQPISGYEFAEPSTQKIQDDEFLNQGKIMKIWDEQQKGLNDNTNLIWATLIYLQWKEYWKNL